MDILIFMEAMYDLSWYLWLIGDILQLEWGEKKE